MGLEAALTGGMSISQQPESLPELVERFRLFVEALVADYEKVVIGIDELDKLRSAQEAEKFLNGIKSVFGIPKCFYLISVSEHALSAFERRGLGFRDAFDSAFDDVCLVNYSELAGSRDLLGRRIVNFPEPFVHLCHMLSGGLPRDLIRYARMVLEIADAHQKDLDVATTARLLVRAELDGKVLASSVALRMRADEAEISELLVSVAELSNAEDKTTMAVRTSEVRRLAEAVRVSGKEYASRVSSICEELVTYVALLDAIEVTAELANTAAGWQTCLEVDLTQLVASARQGIEVSAALATARLGRFNAALASTSPDAQPPAGARAAKSPRKRPRLRG